MIITSLSGEIKHTTIDFVMLEDRRENCIGVSQGQMRQVRELVADNRLEKKDIIHGLKSRKCDG
jgi:hypothetical protein